VTRHARGREAAFTLIELVVAMALASIVIIGMNSLLLPLVRVQAQSMHTQTAQASLTGALSAVEKAVRQASLVTTPSMPGFPSNSLAGCTNAILPGPALPPVALDPSQPMGWFALCAADGRFYYHEGTGCPAVYSCGANAVAEFGGGLAPSATASFSRSTKSSAAIDISLTAASGDTTLSANTAVAFAAAAGTNQ
jgi:prepilin-type N-terminal cleavage/methylation domain-containing protein